MLMKYSLFTIWSILVNLKNVPVGSAAISVATVLVLAAESPVAIDEDPLMTLACCSTFSSCFLFILFLNDWLQFDVDTIHSLPSVCRMVFGGEIFN